ncbi:hypothetical protein A0U40_05355 [[Bacillus] sp. KCTC 13219]|nr:hypothetical protein A0U40_05355 [[Bacillus] sp. KCTC 13219]
MQLIGDVEITKQQMAICRRELQDKLSHFKSRLRECKKSRTRLIKQEHNTDEIDYKIRKLEKELESLNVELKYFSAKYQPVLLYDIVINYKLLQEILRKTKMLHNVQIQKGSDAINVVWDNKGTKGKYTLYDIRNNFKGVIYFPELVTQD